MAADRPGYRFLPWVRSGLAATLATPDTLGAGTPGRARLEVSVRLSRRAGAAVDVDRRLSMLGPGEVVGLDPRQVIRTDPPRGATDVEPNFLVQVELDRPDLPWLFTPAGASAAQRLRPWLVLVVVEDGPGATLRPAGGAPLPVLELTADAEPARQLPDLAQSWAWAHGQVLLLPGEEVGDVLGAVPQRDAARLLCPRRLDPGTRYLACVVPAFEAGRRAGLGLEPDAADEAGLRPAWQRGATAVTLPVYVSWRFSTGGGGDFEQLARALRPRPLAATAGLQPVYAGAAGNPLPAVRPDRPGGIVALAGALVAPGVTAPPWPPQTRTTVEGGLTGMLDAAAQRTGGVAGAPPAAGDPVVGPPLYGQWLAARRTTPAAGEDPAWLRSLNLDPRHRAVAGLGAVAVTGEQERLMDQAWAQVGAVEQANRELRWAQLAREVRGSLLRRHLAPLDPGDVLGVTSAVHRRVRARSGTVATAVAASALPDAVVTTGFRRTTAPRGALARRLDPGGPRGPRPLVARLDAAALRVGVAAGPPDGLFGFAHAAPAREGVPADVVARIGAARAAATARRPAVLRGTQLLTRPLTPEVSMRVGRAIGLQSPTAAQVSAFRDLAVAAAQRAGQVADVAADPPRPALGVAALAGELLARLDPSTTVTARLQARIRTADGVRRRPGSDPLREVLAAPVLPQPAWEYVRDYAPDLLLPGLHDVKQDSVTLAETNPAFAEAFLAGLNHELARELLWREYPTDQRGSCFRRFWAPGGADDVPALHTWTTGDLGDHTAAAADTRLVLVLRGRLLFRYPHTVVYAAPDRGGRPDLSEGAVLMPSFRGRMDPDVAFCGFALTREQARAAPGWWFLLEEQPTAPRFGLDVATGFGAAAGAVREWNDLSWGHLADDAAGLAALSHLDVDRQPPSPPSGPRWGTTSAAMAAILAQQPVRVAIRARDLLPEATP
jgi:hypothetical protein